MGEIVTVDRRVQAVNQAFEQAQENILKALPDFMQAENERFMQLALETARRPDVVVCDPVSLVAAVMKAAQCGLPLDGTHAAIVPFKEGGSPRAVFVPMFQGFIVSALRNGRVKSVWSNVMYDGDFWAEERGTQPALIHRPILGNRTIDKAFAVYACAKLESGDVIFELMDRGQVEAIKKTSKALKSGPWSKPDHEPEMWRKTAIRRLAKYMPKSPDLQRVLDADDEYERMQPREVEVEDITPPRQTQSSGPKRELGDLVPPQQQTKSQPTNGAAKPQISTGELPPVRWYHNIEIHLGDPAEMWLDQALNSKGPLNGLSYRNCASSTEKVVRDAVKAVLDEGAALQEKNGVAAAAYQKMAEACRVFDNANLNRGPLDAVEAEDENRV